MSLIFGSICHWFYSMGYEISMSHQRYVSRPCRLKRSIVDYFKDDGVCSLMNIYVLLASWVNPTLGMSVLRVCMCWKAEANHLAVLIYSTCLVVVASRHESPAASEPAAEKHDIECAPTPTVASPPIMEVPRSHRGSESFASIAHKHLSAGMSRQPWLATLPPSPGSPLPQALPDTKSPTSESSTSSKHKSTRSSARLSKPLPSKYF